MSLLAAGTVLYQVMPTLVGGQDVPVLVSVCVATYERAERLPGLFEALAAQTVAMDSFELIVVDDGSRDNTSAVLYDLAAAAPFETFVLRLQENGGAARARNAAWRTARSVRVLFTDDDCLPEPQWIAGHLRSARVYDIVVGLTGPAEAEVPDGPYARVLRVEDERFYATCNVSYRLSHLTMVNGFDERFRHAGEDTDLGLRVKALGATAGFSREARVRHPIRPSSLRAALGQSTRWADIVLVIRKHPREGRALLHRRFFWKQTHAPAILLIVGCLFAGSRRWGEGLAIAASCSVPWVRLRRKTHPPTSLPGTLLLDVVEVAVMLQGSARHRALVL